MKSKTLIAGAVLAASTIGSSVALAESPLTANIGLNSNYIWRGVTQTNDQAAISGGIDYAADFGLYAGTWVSNLSGGQYEQDWYAGYGMDAGPVGLDFGAILYTYPVGPAQLDFAEAYFNASWEWLSGGVAYTFNKESDADTGDIYAYVGADFEVAKGLGLGVIVGKYDIKPGSASDYVHYGVNLSKDDFTFALDKTDQDGAAGDYRFTVGYSKSFDLL